jgi:shikimate dehydrogenase
VAAVIGHPVVHSRSPAIHNAAFAALGLDWVYTAFDVAPGGGAAAVEAMRTLGLAGLSVTMPHKADVVAALDEVDDHAARLGAVNCIAVRDGRLVGHNTDGAGFLASLAEEAGFDARGRRCVVAGAGGAARSIVAALAGAGAAEVVVLNRTPDRAERAAALAGGVGRVGGTSDLAAADLVVNATSVGMVGNPGLPVDPGGLHGAQVVADIVVEPLRTELLAAAAERGATTVGGLGMLVHQAAIAFTHWTGHDAPLEAMRRGATR